MLVRDFDEVDKYMVNAELLFKDLSNQKELDSSFDFLTDEQREFLNNFWGDFDEREGTNKKNFLRIWQRLPEVYQTFKKQLLSEGLAYEGLLHREVADKLSAGELKPVISPIWFVGFNALTLAEEKIISWFVEQAKAEIHWDVDAYYLNNETQEAGEFFRQYQNHKVLGKTFPVDVPANFLVKKSVKVLGAAQPVGQAKLMSQLLKEEIEASVRLEPGVLTLYAVSEKENPNHITILEIYANADAYKAHLQTPHFIKYKTATKDMVKSLELSESVPLLPGMKIK